MTLLNTPTILSKASKRNLCKKNLHIIKKAKIEKSDSSISNVDSISNIIVNQADKRVNIFYDPLKVC